MVLAVAVASVLQVLVAVLCVERDHTQAVGEEFIGENGGIALDLDNVEGEGGHFGQDRAAEGVGEGEVDGAESEVDTVRLRLIRG